MMPYRLSSRPLVSAIIPTTGHSPHLRGLLERLRCQRLKNSDVSIPILFEIILVANLPRQDLRTLVASMNLSPRCKFEYLETGKIGVNLARNKGLERARGEILLFLDDDVILEDMHLSPENFLEAHYEKHQLHSDAIAIGGPYHLVGSISKWDTAYHQIADQWIRKQMYSDIGSEQLLGGNLSLKLDRLRALSVRFDESIPYGGSESSFCHRLSALNQTLLYIEELSVGHDPAITKKKFMRKAFLQGSGAAWRKATLGDLRFVRYNSFAPLEMVNVEQDKVRLYDNCFQFGFECRPFGNDLAKNSSVDFSYLDYAFYFLFKAVLRASRYKPSLLIRSLYASARSIFISARY